MTADGVSVDGVVAAVSALRDRIVDAGGDVDRITLVAVTKGFGPDAVRAAVAAGVTDIGENYAQELLTKASDAAVTLAAPRWHFIGRLQRNKVRLVGDLVHLWQSVDRASVATEIAKRAPGAGVLLQVNLTDDPARGGCRLEEVDGLVTRCHDLGLEPRGLMAVGPPGGPSEARSGFRAVVRLADRLGLAERSLGMTADLDEAVAAGTTMVRVGTGLFGPR